MRKFSLKSFYLGFLFMGAALFAASSAYSYEQLKQVVEVRYIGLSSISPRDLENMLPFSPGDIWDEKFEENAEQIIKAQYAKRGFFNAKVNVYYSNPFKEKNRIIMTVNVDEGPPCLIGNFLIDEPSGFKSKHLRERFMKKTYEVAAVKSGDRYDEVWMADKMRLLKEWLVTQDFILADTDQVSLKFNDNYTVVSVVVQVNYGDRVTFGFQGNTIFSRGELNEIITQLRSTDLSRDYQGMIQRKFIEEYRNRAHNNVKVESVVTERDSSKHITFFFNEGRMMILKDITWEGLTPENAKIAEKVLRENSSRFLQHDYYVERDLDNALNGVIEDLKGRGFLMSKLISRTTKPVKTRLKDYDYTTLHIHIFEGEQTLVGEVALNGFNFFPPEKIKNILHLETTKPFNPFLLEEGLQKMVAAYRNQGFLEFKLKSTDEDIVTYQDSNRLAQILLVVEEGPRIRIDDIQIKGLELTKPYVVEREYSFKPDDWWLGEKIQETETILKKMGLFSEVKIHADVSPRGPDYRKMVIEVKEVDPGAFEVGPGFRSDLGVRAFSRLSYNNFFGKNWIGILSAETNRRIDNQYRFIEYKLDASVIEPRLFSSKNLLSLGISTRKQRFPPDFNAVTTQFAAGIERKLFNIITAKFSYKLERIRQFDVIINNLRSDVDNQTLLIGSLGPSVTVDTRDSPFTTSKGQLTTLSLEYADPNLSAQAKDDPNAVGYYRWTGATHWYFPLTKDIVWVNVAAGGFERSNIAGRAIPLIKLFRLGGYSSIRGFREETINVDNVSIKGTLTFINLRTQFELPFIGDLKIAPFLDAGNLFIDKLQNYPFFRSSAGLGFHYTTPIGPINFDYGVKLNRKDEDSSSQIHFSVGFI